MDASRPAPAQAGLDLDSARAVFAELLAQALRAQGARPSLWTEGYLVDLLLDRLRRPESAGPPGEGEPTLGEALLLAHRERGADRVRRLRDLGDRALFVAGVFGDRLSRSLVDLDYYGDVGSAAYGQLARCLDSERTWSELYRELAAQFACYVDVLAEVGDRTRGRGAGPDLLRLYDRYVTTGSERDRLRLVRRGLAPVPPAIARGLRRWQ